MSVGSTLPSYQVTQPVSFTWAGLTDTQLRASAVPVSIATLPALTAGAAVIGAVTQSGTWNVGSITTLPALVAGSAIVGKVGIDQTTPGTTNLVQVGGSLPAGTNAIGTVTTARPTTVTRTSVTAAAADTLILAANAARFGATVWNESDKVMYLALGAAAASLTSYTAQVAVAGYYETPFGYTGAIRAIWAAGPTGSARVTEIA